MKSAGAENSVQLCFNLRNSVLADLYAFPAPSHSVIVMCTVFPSNPPIRLGIDSQRSCNTPVRASSFVLARNIMRLACIHETRSLCKESFFTLPHWSRDDKFVTNVSQIPSIALRMHRTESRRCVPFRGNFNGLERRCWYPPRAWFGHATSMNCIVFRFDNCFTSAWCAADGIYLIVRCTKLAQLSNIAKGDETDKGCLHVSPIDKSVTCSNIFEGMAPTNESSRKCRNWKGRCWQFWQSWWRNLEMWGVINSHQMWGRYGAAPVVELPTELHLSTAY